MFKGDLINWPELGRTLVVIDAANLEQSVKSMGWWVDYVKLYAFFKNKTTLVDIRYYAPHFNDARQNNFFTVLKKHGFTLITKPLKIIAEIDKECGHIRKANFDVEITLDVVMCMDTYDTFILFSGDSDFNCLIKKVRCVGKKAVVISSRYHIARELIESCNRYLDLKKLRDEIERKGK